MMKVPSATSTQETISSSMLGAEINILNLGAKGLGSNQ